MLPLSPNIESLLSPSTERDCLNNGGRNDFFPRECTPCYWIDGFSICGFEVTGNVGGKVCDFFRVGFEFAFQFCPVCGWKEDFDKGLWRLVSLTVIGRQHVNVPSGTRIHYEVPTRTPHPRS